MPADGLFIVGATIAAIFGFIALIRAIETARNKIRESYLAATWHPRIVDLLGIPAWIALELVCFGINLVLTIVIIWGAYGAATSFRDWWHARE